MRISDWSSDVCSSDLADYLFDPISLDFIGIPGMVAFDSWRYYNDGNYTLTDEAGWTPWRIFNDYTIREKVLTGLVKATFYADAGDTPFSRNFSIQILHYDQTWAIFHVVRIDSVEGKKVSL